jgi:tRNA (guanine37-N1)-methyltransferase
MKFHIITIFPNLIKDYLNESLIKKAQEKNLIEVSVVDLRDYTEDKRSTVDDAPYGGGPGMVLMVSPIYKAVEDIKSKSNSKIKTILFSTRGNIFNQSKAKELKEFDELILICGRYEGVDERVAKYIADEEISIGDFVLQGGELPALVLTEAITRYIPGVLGKKESLEDIKGYYPVYTRPEIFNDWQVPDVLLSGDHKKIEEWRENNGFKN